MEIEDVVFNYTNSSQPKHHQLSENTQFNFIDRHTIYKYNHESVFTPVSIDTFAKTCDLSATLVNGNLFISIGEAGTDNYTKAELKRGLNPHSLAVAFIRDSTVKNEGGLQTPWRTISFSKTAIGLHQFSQLNLKLNFLLNKIVPA